MMRYLLDTEVLLRVLSGVLDKNHLVYGVLSDKNARIYASAANVLEVAIKKAMKHIKIPNNFNEAILESGIEILDISPEHAWKTLRLPFHHKDSYDRLLIAQAMCEDLTLITADPQFDAYNIKTLKL